MIYVFEGGSVIYDGNTISEEQRNQAVAVESLPEPEQKEGKIAVIRANKAEERVYYEYVDIPQSPLEDEIEQLRVEMAQSNAELIELMMMLGGM